MIRTFVNERKQWDNITQINTETEEVRIYAVDKELGCPFSEYTTTASEMGWHSTSEFINRMTKTSDYEADTEQQTEKEIAGLFNLAKYRAGIGHFTYITLKDGTRYNDIVERLKVYGLSEDEIVKKIEKTISGTDADINRNLTVEITPGLDSKRSEREIMEKEMIQVTLKANDKVKVHFYDWNYSDHREIMTKNYDKVFTVYEKNGKLGIDWNTERCPYDCKGDIFTPFETFAQTVIFENVETGETFYFSNIENKVVKNESNESEVQGDNQVLTNAVLDEMNNQCELEMSHSRRSARR